MANRVLINKQILQDSIDAIRAKKGTTDSIVVADMPTEIASIEGGGSGIADSTKTLVGAISGVTPTDETTLNNAIAKAYADTPSEQKWNGTRSTAEGGTIKDGVAFVESVKGSTMKFNQLCENGDFQTKNGWYNLSSATDGVGIRNCTTSEATSANIFRGTTLVEGHKYLSALLLRLSTANKVQASLTYTYGTPINVNANTWTCVFGVNTASSLDANTPRTSLHYNRNTAVTSGDTIEVKQWMLFDLTAMGKEDITTADAMAQYLGYADYASMPFLAYQPTTNLRNFTHNTITSKDEDNATLDTLSLNVPSSVFPNGMNGVGTAFDEWKPAEGKAIKRIGKVDLGTLTWSKNGSTFLSFGISMPNKPYAQWDELHNILCDEYSAVSAKDAYQNNVTGVFGPTSGVSGAGINIKDVDRASTMDANEFKSAMSGKYVYYELKTPTETTTDKAKAFFKVANGGTETISGGTNSTPIKADIGYRGMSAEELVTAINI